MRKTDLIIEMKSFVMCKAYENRIDMSRATACHGITYNKHTEKVFKTEVVQ